MNASAADVRFTEEAEEDFQALIGYLSERNPFAASELSKRVFRIIEQIARRELEGMEQTLTTGEVVRSWAVPPVRIYYQRASDAFWVLRIYHQARAPIVR